MSKNPNETLMPDANGGLRPTRMNSRLGLMMFLQYFVQGCYLPIASVYVEKTLGFSGLQIGLFGSALAVGPILAPFVLGQIVDRLVPTQRVLAFCHVLAGLFMLALYAVATFWDHSQGQVWTVIGLGAVYSVLYVSTMMLSNSLAFQHLKDRDRQFPIIRLFGTIGFVVPAYVIEFIVLRGLEGPQLHAARGVAFLFAGIMGVVMGVYSLTLPDTPPQQRDDRKYAPAVVMRMMRLRHFFVLIVISFLIAMVHKFYFVWNSPFLRDVLDSGGVKGAYEQSISSIGQICEVGVMAVLGFAIARYGFKWTMLVGTIAYAVRCLMFAMVFGIDMEFAARMTLACSGQALHGFCFGCFLAAGYMYVDRVAPKDVRGSMQTMYGTFVLALGFFFSGVASGWVGDVFTTKAGEVPFRQTLGVESTVGLVPTIDAKTNEVLFRDWPGIWLTCGILAVVCVIAFAALFPRGIPSEEGDELAGDGLKKGSPQIGPLPKGEETG